MMSQSFEVHAASHTHTGLKRSNNEDFATFFEPVNHQDLEESGRLYIVADGVGGAAQGERASRYASEKVLHEYYQQVGVDPRRRLRHAIRQAGNEIFDFAENERIQMATTIVIATILGDQLILANVGDSRAYLIRGGLARQLTQDHTEAAEMVRSGMLTEEEAAKIKGNRISRSIGGEANVEVDVYEPIRLKPGDRVLLCTDGLTRYANRDAIAKIAATGRPDDVVEQLVDFANQHGGADNITALLVSIGGPASVESLVSTGKRDKLPNNVDWDTMEWEVPSSAKTREGWLDRIVSFFVKNPWLFVGVCLALVVFSLGIILLSLRTPSPSASLDDPRSTVEAVGSQLTVTTQFISHQETEEAASPTPLPPTTTPFPTITPTPIPTEVPTEALEDRAMSCEYEVVDGDTLSVIMLDKLRIALDLDVIRCPYNEPDCIFEDCLNGLIDCEKDESGNPVIYPGDLLIFPDVLKSICDEVGITSLLSD
jgi:protein phosphatase